MTKFYLQSQRSVFCFRTNLGHENAMKACHAKLLCVFAVMSLLLGRILLENGKDMMNLYS